VPTGWVEGTLGRLAGAGTRERLAVEPAVERVLDNLALVAQEVVTASVPGDADLPPLIIPDIDDRADRAEIVEPLQREFRCGWIDAEIARDVGGAPEKITSGYATRSCSPNL
jgi:hypothetical protein